MIKDLLPYSKPLSVLYVEDDSEIRENYARVFQELFSSFQTADDGLEGLEKYTAAPCDLLITDINMPRMNGIDMIAKILEINPEQSIIVTSAHDEAQYLLQLIDLGIEKFLIKPVNFSKMAAVLFRSCKRISEFKELHEYQNRIEDENLHASDLLKELKRKNRELELTIKQLTRNENVNIALLEGIEKEKTFTPKQLDFFTPHPTVTSAEDFIAHFPGDVDSLNDKLEPIEETLELAIHQKLSDPSKESVEELSKAFIKYSEHLASTFKFNNLANALENFGLSIAKVEDLSLLKEMKSLLFGIADSLHKWRQEVLVKKTAEDIHFLDNSIISDCMQTESMLSNGVHHAHQHEDVDDLFF